MSKIPCVCSKGEHNFSVYQMTEIIAAYQRGELQVTGHRGIRPICLEQVVFLSPVNDNGPCGVILPNGLTCKKNKGHRTGAHN